MPRVSDASMMTRAIRVDATSITPPTKKSRVFLATQPSIVGAEIKASEVNRSTAVSVLRIAEWKSPQFNGRIFLK